MTAPKDSVAQAIIDARALLDALVTNGWKEMHVVSGDSEIFLARQGGRANPMRHIPVPAPPAPAPSTEGGQGRETKVQAPHVATLVSVLAVGTSVAAGQSVATLRVLEAETEVAATVGGTIVRVDAVPGDLLDYAALLLSIEEGA